MSDREIKVVPDLGALATEAAGRIVAVATRAVEDRGTFSIALSGGNTPRPVDELLAREPYRSQIDWGRIQVFFGDERCVPPDSEQSNYRMAREALLSKVPIPQENIHRIRGEIDPHEAAIQYGQLLKDRFADCGLDLVLLGMGPDGHTASLFPGTQALHEATHRCVANYVEKLKSWRVTMTAPFINRARAVLFLVSGADKAQALAQVLQGPRDADRLPAQLIRPTGGALTWLLDAAAAGDVK